MEKDTSKEKTSLNPKQELFCQLFASDREFFGNGVQAYIKAYDIDLSKKNAYHTARVSAHDLLTKPNVTTRINEIFEAHGLNDTFVDKQLEKLIVQDADFTNKMSAIKEYNNLRQRITKKLQLGNDPDNPIVPTDPALTAKWTEFLKSDTNDE